jgi:hypothetical protein
MPNVVKTKSAHLTTLKGSVDDRCMLKKVADISWWGMHESRAERLITVLLPNHKHRGTQISCPTLREQRRPVSIGEVLAVVFN